MTTGKPAFLMTINHSPVFKHQGLKQTAMLLCVSLPFLQDTTGQKLCQTAETPTGMKPLPSLSTTISR